MQGHAVELTEPGLDPEPKDRRLDLLRKYSGALLDVDGILVDSEHLHYLENKVFFACYDVKITTKAHIDYWIKGDGGGTRGCIEDNWIEGRDDLGVKLDLKFAREERQRIFREHLLPDLKPKPGAIEFLEYLHDLNIPVAAVSSGYRDSVVRSLEITKLMQYIDAVIAHEDVQNRKPHPESYLKGAEEIEIPIKECVVAEDAPKGITAANRAEAGYVVGCPDEWTINLDFTGEARPDIFVKSLPEIIGMDLFWVRH